MNSIKIRYTVLHTEEYIQPTAIGVHDARAKAQQLAADLLIICTSGVNVNLILAVANVPLNKGYAQVVTCDLV